MRLEAHQLKWWSWLLKLWQRKSPSLTAMVPPPDYSSHPFSAGMPSSPAWYALLVPTHHEGHEVLLTLPNLLAKQSADFTVFVGFATDDPTGDFIRKAAALDDRIVPVEAVSEKSMDLEQALIEALGSREDLRRKRATDAIIVPFPLLEVRKRHIQLG